MKVEVRRFLGAVAVAALSAVAIVALQNVLLAAWFPNLARLTTDFSPAYLRRAIARDAASRSTVFLGDSVVWGYRLVADETAVGLLAARGCACENLAFKEGGPANYLGIALAFRALKARPRLVVLQINQKVLSTADPAFNSVVPAVAELAGPLYSPVDRSRIQMPAGQPSPWERVLTDVSTLYAMRTDLRETLFGEPDSGSTARPPIDAFVGAYDLTPLDARNHGVELLMETVRVLRGAGIPILAFTTPTNHQWLADYIDGPEYRRNDVYLVGRLRGEGARVLDLDGEVPDKEFIDNDHLTREGQRHLARLLAPAVSQTPSIPTVNRT